MSQEEIILEHLQAFQRGEEKGFNFFFRNLYSSLVYFSFNILNDKQAAEEVVEDSFVKIWDEEQRTKFNHQQQIRSWLYTTVRNASINRLKHDKRLLGKEKEFIRLAAEEHTQPVVRDIIHAEIYREIMQAMDCLPKECKKIFAMLYIEGKTVNEIAAELNLSVSTVKTQKTRGISVIRAKLFTTAAVAAAMEILS